MKINKLVIAAAIVCATAFVQAASIDWQASFNFVDASGNIETAATAPAGSFVLCFLGTTADYSWDNAKAVNSGTIEYGSGKSGNYAKVSGSYSWTYNEANTPSNGDVFGVMFKDVDGNLSKLQTTEGAAIDPTFTITGMGGNTYMGQHYFASSAYTTAPTSSIPEPTSGLLLVVGGALLALRRKQK